MGNPKHTPSIFDNMSHESAARLTEQLIDPHRVLTPAETRLTEYMAKDVLNLPIT